MGSLAVAPGNLTTEPMPYDFTLNPLLLREKGGEKDINENCTQYNLISMCVRGCRSLIQYLILSLNKNSYYVCVCVSSINTEQSDNTTGIIIIIMALKITLWRT